MRGFIRVSLLHLFAIILFVADFGIMQPGVDAVAEAQTSGGGTNPVMSGTMDLTTVGSTYMMPVVNGQGVLGVDLTGLTGSGATVVAESTVNSTLWSGANMLVVGTAGALTTSITSDSSFRINVAGKTWVRLRVSVAGSGTAAVTGSLSTDSSIVQLSAPLPPGVNTIGGVTVTNFPASQPISGSVSVSNFPASQPVTGTFWQTTQPVSGSVSVSNFPATQPVSGSVSLTGSLPAGSNALGSVSVSNFPATQAVSGTVGISGTVSTTPATCANAPTTQVAVGTSAVQIVAARAGRYKVTVAPTTGATYYVSTASNVTTSTGLPIINGGAFTFTSPVALYAVAAASMTLGAMECY